LQSLLCWRNSAIPQDSCKNRYELVIEKEGFQIRSLLHLKKYVVHYRLAIIFSFILVLLTNCCLLISPKILGRVIDNLERAIRDPAQIITPRTVFLYALLIFGVALVGGASWATPTD
jgi:ABC-type multidrug transport system fused ATPase/permease subunit